MSSTARPLDIYFWPTPNCWKITVFCEENNIPYILKPINILEGEQFSKEYKRVNPFSKVPVIIDYEGPDGAPVTIAESGAILLYLSQKIGRNVPALQSLKSGCFSRLALSGRCSVKRTTSAATVQSQSRMQLSATLTKHPKSTASSTNDCPAQTSWLVVTPLLISVFPWSLFYKRQRQSKESYPHFARWYDIVKARPTVRRGIDAGKELRSSGPTKDQFRTLFEGVPQKTFQG